jgi:6-phosphogluconolactonase (cycloisomerase 2 family)
MPSKFLYANASGGPNSFPTATYGFAVYPGGALRPLSGFSPVEQEEYGGWPLVITRDSKFLYTWAYVNNGLAAFQINPDGSLTNAPSPTFSLFPLPLGLVAHPTANFLYASSSTSVTGVLSVLAINSQTGALNLTSSVSFGGNNIEIGAPQSGILGNSAVITPGGGYLYQGYAYNPNSVGQSPTLLQFAGFSIDSATGALSAIPGSPVSLTIPYGFSSITQMAVNPTGTFLYAGYRFGTSVGEDGAVAAFSIAPSSGALTAVPGSPFSVRGASYSVAIDASGRFLIVGGPQATAAHCLDVLSIDPGTGALALVPGSPFVGCGAVAADASEPFVYVGNGSETASAEVLVLSLDQTTGALAPIGQAAVPDTSKLGVSFIAVTQ